MLDMLEPALKRNNISFLHVETKNCAKHIEKFQSDPNVTVLLLSLQNDNSGLTLVSATNVFLMEPSLNPNVEAQAINRINRIGQKRETFVYKFIMNKSIEERIDTRASHGQSGGESNALLRQSKEVGCHSLCMLFWCALLRSHQHVMFVC